MRFHVLGIPHTISTPEYSSCAFTQKVVKLCRMLSNIEGHEVFHYGNAASKIAGTHVTVTKSGDLKKSYPDNNWRRDGWPAFSKSDPIYATFYENAQIEIQKRARPGDFLLCSFGDYHRPVADMFPNLIVVESGIGYPNGTFAPFKIFESYAMMHAYQGNVAAQTASNSFWYNAVIPNAFSFADFEYRVGKSNYFLFLGRVNDGKGVHIARQIAEATKTKLIVAGPGNGLDTEFVTHVGVVSPSMRKRLLAGAKATICASTYLEPFCGVQIESMLSGTPVISSDWGAFAEYNKHGETGFRCKTFEQFEWAARNIDTIEPINCYDWGKRFSLANIAPMYTDYFRSVKDVFDGKGWYEPRRDRTTLENSSF